MIFILVLVVPAFAFTRLLFTIMVPALLPVKIRAAQASPLSLPPMSGSQKTVPSLPPLARLADVYVRCHNEPLLVTPTHTLCITKAKVSTRISTHGHAPPPQRHPYPGTCVRPLSCACIPKTLVVYCFTSAKGFPVDCKFLEFMVGIQCLKLLRCIHVVADGCGEFFLTTKRCPVVWLCRRRLSSVPLAGSGLLPGVCCS